ncbi:MAG: tRNA dimethylallyltransferase [Cyclobacteriaceae bacterium]
MDSRQVFRKMDIGTGKDLGEYSEGGEQVPVHLIDIKDAGEDYHVAAFQDDFESVIQDLNRRQVIPVLCGGSGLYLEAVLEGLQLTQVPVDRRYRDTMRNKTVPELILLLNEGISVPYHVDVKSKKRLVRALEIQRYLASHPEFKISSGKQDFEIFILDLPRETRRNLISERLKKRFEEGLLQEVEQLRQILPDEQLMRYGLEYKWITLHLNGTMSYDEMFTKLETEIHRFAKRQMTWFRRLSRKYPAAHWLDATLTAENLTEYIIEYVKY